MAVTTPGACAYVKATLTSLAGLIAGKVPPGTVLYADAPSASQGALITAIQTLIASQTTATKSSCP
jgi:hypothetical protein